MGILSRGARAARPQVRVANPVLARYLDDLAARAMASGAKADDLDAVIAGMTPPPAAEPLADALRRNDRTRALVQSRLDRLEPEQMPGSLGLVGRQFDADSAAARAADIRYGRDLNTAAALAGAGIVGGGAMYGHMSQLAEEIARGQGQKDFDLGPDLSGDPDGAMPMTIDIGEDSPISGFDPAAEMAAAAPMPEVEMDDGTRAFMERWGDASVPEQEIRKDTVDQLLAQPYVSTPPRGLEQRFKNSRPAWASDFAMPTPEEAVEAAPGPEAPVGRQAELEDLPGPQLRSIRALMRGGVPEGRARDIILKGSSMSPEEYRMVTGGRR